MQDKQFEDAQLIKHMEEKLNKAKKSIQEMNDIIKKIECQNYRIPEGVEKSQEYRRYSMKL